MDTKKTKKCNLYGHVTGEESDSENSSVYHEPYKLLPSAKQEYGCLLKKDAISSSKSGEYTGKTILSSGFLSFIVLFALYVGNLPISNWIENGHQG